MERIENRGANGVALVPLLVFILILVGTGVFFSIQEAEEPFGQMHA